MISPNIKNFIIAAVVIGASFWIYSSFIVKSEDEDSLISAVPAASGLEASSDNTGSQILKILSNLKTIRIDKTFFSEASFTKLQDYSVNLTEEQAGRKNPFISPSVETNTGTTSGRLSQ